MVKNGLADYARAQRGTIVQTEEWLKRRFELFEKYCYPSICGQTTKNFKWLVLFNSETPEKYKAIIERYQQDCPLFRPVFIQPYDDEIQQVIHLIKKEASTPYVITTRIDNDDMIKNDYMEFIQNSFRPEYTNTFLFYRFGYQLNTKKSLLLKFGDDFNHFESRVELIENLQTVYVENDRHDLIYKYGEVVGIADKGLSNDYNGMWIEVVHDCNVVNNAGDGYCKPMMIDTKLFSPNLDLSKKEFYLMWVKNAAISRVKRVKKCFRK